MATTTDESRAKARARYSKDPERYKEYHRVWREKNHARIAEYRAEERKNKTVAYFMRETKNRAAKQKVEFALTEKLLESMLAPMTCSATGMKLSWDWVGSSRSNPWAPSIDRIEASKGYVPGNIRIVCWIYNSAKLDWPESLVLEMARALVSKENSNG